MRTGTMWKKFGPAIAAGMAMSSAMGADGKSLPIAPVITGTSAAAAAHTQEVAGSENYKGAVEFRMNREGDPLLSMQGAPTARVAYQTQTSYDGSMVIPTTPDSMRNQPLIGMAAAVGPIVTQAQAPEPIG